MTKKKLISDAVAELKHIEETLSGDPENAHVQADECLLALLRELGFEEVCRQYNATADTVNFWYA